MLAREARSSPHAPLAMGGPLVLWQPQPKMAFEPEAEWWGQSIPSLLVVILLVAFYYLSPRWRSGTIIIHIDHNIIGTPGTSSTSPTAAPTATSPSAAGAATTPPTATAAAATNPTSTAMAAESTPGSTSSPAAPPPPSAAASAEVGLSARLAERVDGLEDDLGVLTDRVISIERHHLGHMFRDLAGATTATTATTATAAAPTAAAPGSTSSPAAPPPPSAAASAEVGLSARLAERVDGLEHDLGVLTDRVTSIVRDLAGATTATTATTATAAAPTAAAAAVDALPSAGSTTTATGDSACQVGCGFVLSPWDPDAPKPEGFRDPPPSATWPRTCSVAAGPDGAYRSGGGT